MSFMSEFKEFAVKGNVVDLAVGVIIGGAFGKIVTSLVDQVVMPPIGWLIGGVDFSDLKITLPANPANPAPAAGRGLRPPRPRGLGAGDHAADHHRPAGGADPHRAAGFLGPDRRGREVAEGLADPGAGLRQ